MVPIGVASIDADPDGMLTTTIVVTQWMTSSSAVYYVVS